MKSLIKCIRNIDWVEVFLTGAIIGCIAMFTCALIGCIYDMAAANKNETEIEFVEAVKYGELDSGETLFMLEDGNLFSFHATFAEKNGRRFLVALNNHGTENRTDDEIIELWTTPQVDYHIVWSD